jgi:hypothetical protein
MTILHLLSQLEVTGAETYVESLGGELTKHGHRFLVASDTGHRVTARTLSRSAGSGSSPASLGPALCARSPGITTGIEG